MGVGVLGTSLLANPAVAHGVDASHGGIGFSLVVAAVVGVSLFGGVVLAVGCGLTGRFGHRLMSGVLALLGVSAVGLAVERRPRVALVGAAVGVAVAVLACRQRSGARSGTDDVTFGAVTVHRALEGCTLAVVYAADATLALVGALVLAGHAAAETAVVGSLYARRHDQWAAFTAVGLVQVGFVVGATAGDAVVRLVPSVVRTASFGLVGAVLLSAGVLEAVSGHGGEGESEDREESPTTTTRPRES